MFTQLTTLTKATIYYAIAFVLAFVIALFGERIGEKSTLVTMFTPLAAVLLMLLVVTRDGYSQEGWKGLGLYQLGLRSWGLAYGGPLLVMSCTYAIVWATGIGYFDQSAASALLTMDGILNLVLSLIVGTAYALAEEVGWRGYFLPHLLPLGRVKALLLSGFLHGVWHLPVLLMTPYYHQEGNRIIVVTLFLLTLTAAGLFYGYLRLTSDSVWPPTLSHGFLNTIWYTFASLTIAGSSPLLLEYMAGESGLLTLVIVAVLSAWLVYRMQRQPVSTPTTTVLTSEPVA